LGKKKRQVRDPDVLDEANAIARRSILALLIRTSGTVISFAIKWGVIGFLGWTMTPHLAGKITNVGVAVDVGGFDWLHKLLGVLCLFLGVAWLLERKNRAHTVEIMSLRNQQLEARLDPKRTSSGLKPDGSSPEEE